MPFLQQDMTPPKRSTEAPKTKSEVLRYKSMTRFQKMQYWLQSHQFVPRPVQCRIVAQHEGLERSESPLLGVFGVGVRKCLSPHHRCHR